MLSVKSASREKFFRLLLPKHAPSTLGVKHCEILLRVRACQQRLQNVGTALLLADGLRIGCRNGCG